MAANGETGTGQTAGFPLLLEDLAPRDGLEPPT